MIKCAVPFIEGFTKSTGSAKYRNCCATNPQIVSKNNQNFSDWWKSKELNKFRESLQKDVLPKACAGCALQEKIQGTSFRTAVNKTVNLNSLNSKWPSRWNVSFGNICNLACWMCSEYSSSVIQTHKKKLGMLKKDFEDPEIKFQKVWKTLELDILKSYEIHDTVTLTILGGEPLYNKQVLDFLAKLVRLNLSRRTKLEFHTNATQCNKKIKDILKLKTWKFICMFLSIDAIGKKAEWLRYGTNWQKLEKNIPNLKRMSNYLEVHCTVSLLNISDLPALKNFCNKFKITFKVNALYQPWYLRLHHWDYDPNSLVDKDLLTTNGFEDLYNLIGKEKKHGCLNALKKYIQKFDSIRKPLVNFDKELAKKLKIH